MAEFENKITEKKKEEILNALKVIQDVCSSNEHCATCPFCSTRNPCNTCSITNESPNNWRISGANEMWRAIL